ncbi:armadillo repeat-containing protein 6 isoform X1 [Cinnamomum micranthum f. kanehirae]|uniref:Armadillo repeat-containing protein 6 isoform X1 n=1 Tax=Cinnamomum micranthum f. kanehirae TaxID=337451 RepID=A0A3S4PMN1_9MAGN|nr:armadillo repeat-containing protein 6 isoform X1 [Cinnamomum micranthum f. kanehirae]
MGPPKSVRTISQQAFEGLVKENMEDLGMDPTEALEDAIQTLTLQGVDLSGIVTCIPGVTSVNDNPVIQSLDGLRDIAATFLSTNDQKADMISTTTDLEGMVELLDKVYALCSIEGSGNASVATRNGGVELLTSICSALDVECERPLVAALKTLSSFLHDLQSTETFRQSCGPKIVVDILNGCNQNMNVLDSGFSVVAAAATGNEVLKESFMDLKIDELLLQTMKGQNKGNIRSLYEALRLLLTPDDNRVLASQVYGYARRFAQIGIAAALVDALHEGISSPSLASASIALKAVAVNDEICRSIAECGGIDAVLQCLDDSGEQNNKAVAKACCSLLSKLLLVLATILTSVLVLFKLAGSDANKSAIVEKGGLDRLITLSSRFSEDPSVLQEIMSIICALSLRSPENAARAIEAGAGDFASQAMLKFPAASQMQRQSCLMIRNLVVRNPENRTILLSNGIERIIRKAKENHETCKEAAADALRDLGLENYNS